MPSLERLDEIAWRRLEGPYGTSGDVPDAIRDLWSDDAARRANAVSFLQQNLWHQGTVYEVTAPAVPYVADAALDDAVGRDDRIWLVLLLSWIADGSSYIDRELGWVREAREAVRARLPEFVARLDDEGDADTQAALVVLAAQFPEEAAEWRPRVERLRAAETEEARRLVLDIALAAFGAHVDDEQLLSRLPDDYYAEEDIKELRSRLNQEDRRAVYRDILDNVVGSVVRFDNA